MYKGKKILVTVCARGCSNGVANKNIKELNGKPLICYSLDLLKKSKLVDDYIVSTDDQEIIAVVKNYGFDVSFKRPSELATDKVSRIDAIKHAVTWVKQNRNKDYDIVVDLGVATPLKNEQDLDASIKLLVENNYSNVFSVTSAPKNPYYNMVEKNNGKICKVKTLSKKITDRRDAPEVYNMNDGLNVWWNKILFSKEPQFNENTGIYVMPAERSIDIDRPIDFKMAEAIACSTNSKNGLLNDKVVVIVGGLGLIGRAFVEAVVANGAHCIVADINKKEGEAFSKAIKSKNANCSICFLELDITSKESIDRLLKYANEKFGKIDAVVNTSYPRNKNWGIKFEDVDFKDFNENSMLHLGGYFLFSQQVSRWFKRQKYGNIINVASIQGVRAPKFDTYKGIMFNNKDMTSPAEYSMFKAGIIHLTAFIAKYYKGCNIRCNCISPGGIKADQPKEFLERYKFYCINKGMLDPQDMCGTLVYLLSDMSKFVNGQNIIVDDGWSL